MCIHFMIGLLHNCNIFVWYMYCTRSQFRFKVPSQRQHDIQYLKSLLQLLLLQVMVSPDLYLLDFQVAVAWCYFLASQAYQVATQHTVTMLVQQLEQHFLQDFLQFLQGSHHHSANLLALHQDTMHRGHHLMIPDRLVVVTSCKTWGPLPNLTRTSLVMSHEINAFSMLVSCIYVNKR